MRAIILLLWSAAAVNCAKQKSSDSATSTSPSRSSQIISPESRATISEEGITVIIPGGTFNETVTGSVNPGTKTPTIVDESVAIESHDIVFVDNSDSVAEPSAPYSVINIIPKNEISNINHIFVILINHADDKETVLLNDQLVVTDTDDSFSITVELSVGSVTVVVCESANPPSSASLSTVNIPTLDTVTDQPFTVDWPDVNGAEKYDVVFGTSSGCGSSFGEQTVTESQIDISQIPNGSYYVCVTASNGNQELSSDEEAFTITYASSPATMMIFYSWNDVTDADDDFYDVALGAEASWATHNVETYVGNVDFMSVGLGRSDGGYHLRYQKHAGADDAKVFASSSTDLSSWSSSSYVDGGPDVGGEWKVTGEDIIVRPYGASYFSAWTQEHQYVDGMSDEKMDIHVQNGSGSVETAISLDASSYDYLDALRMDTSGSAVHMVYKRRKDPSVSIHHLYSLTGSWVDEDISSKFSCNGSVPLGIEAELVALKNGRLAYVYNCYNGVGSDLKVKFYDGNNWETTSLTIASYPGDVSIAATADSLGGLHVSWAHNNSIYYATNTLAADITNEENLLLSSTSHPPRIKITNGGLAAIFYVDNTGATGEQLAVVYGNSGDWSSPEVIYSLPTSGDGFHKISYPVDAL